MTEKSIIFDNKSIKKLAFIEIKNCLREMT